MEKKKIIDADHPFFAKRWVRWATVSVCATLAIADLIAGNPGWSFLFAAAGSWAFYELIYLGPSKS